MDFLRRHVFVIGCGLACLVGVALGITGLNAMPKVQEEMEKRKAVYRNLENLQSGAVSMERLEAEERRIELMLEDRTKVIEKAKDLYPNVVEEMAGAPCEASTCKAPTCVAPPEEGGPNTGEKTCHKYRLLVPDVFPNGNVTSRFRFRDAYAAAMDRLLAPLNYGSTASAVDVELWEGKISDEEAARREMGLVPGLSSAVPALPTGPPETIAGVLTPAGARRNARARADMAAAQRIYCYAVSFRDERPPVRMSSLDFDSELKGTDTGEAPELEYLWRAQVGYWIQKDVIDAIVEINNAAAEEARARDEGAWVGILPVKELISIRISLEYVPPEGELADVSLPGDYAPAFPPGSAESVFTGSASSTSYEVRQYTVKLIMDQRDIPLLVDRICKNSLHVPLRIAYKAVPPNREMVGKVYGSEPTVNVVMDFEVIMLGEVFRRLMPQSVIDYYEIPCRDVDECPEVPEEG